MIKLYQAREDDDSRAREFFKDDIVMIIKTKRGEGRWSCNARECVTALNLTRLNYINFINDEFDMYFKEFVR